jgi:hypothetical protein
MRASASEAEGTVPLGEARPALVVRRLGSQRIHSDRAALAALIRTLRETAEADHREALAWAKRFAEAELLPLQRLAEHARVMAEEIRRDFEQLRSLALLGLPNANDEVH